MTHKVRIAVAAHRRDGTNRYRKNGGRIWVRIQVDAVFKRGVWAVTPFPIFNYEKRSWDFRDFNLTHLPTGSGVFYRGHSKSIALKALYDFARLPNQKAWMRVTSRRHVTPEMRKRGREIYERLTA